MYEVIFAEHAMKQLKKLERSIQERILNTLDRVRIRPEDYLERLVGEPIYKLRVGDYRILFEIDQGKLIILVVKIGHRKNVYDKN